MVAVLNTKYMLIYYDTAYKILTFDNYLLPPDQADSVKVGGSWITALQ